MKTLATVATHTIAEGVNHSFPLEGPSLLPAFTIFCTVAVFKGSSAHLMQTVISLTEADRFSPIEILALKSQRVNLQIRRNVQSLEAHSQKLL